MSPYRMTMESKELVVSSAELENPHRLLAGRFDLAFVIVYLYPLLILVLGYNLLSAEKEQGTLTLTLSQPVRLRTLVDRQVSASPVPRGMTSTATKASAVYAAITRKEQAIAA